MQSDSLSFLLAKADNRQLLASLLAAGTELVVVGGTALAHHGLRDVMAVDDLDLMVNPTKVNAERVGAVLESLRMPLTNISSALARPAVQVPLKGGQYWAELLTPVREIEFESVYACAVTAVVGELLVRVASIADLLRMKQLAVNELRSSLKKHEVDLQRLQDA